MSREPSTPSVLHSVASMLGRQVTRDRLVRVMIDRVVEELGAERGTISLVDAITGELWSRVAHLPEIEEIRMPPGTGVAGHVAETGEPVMLADVTTDEHFFPGIDRMTGYPPGTPPRRRHPGPHPAHPRALRRQPHRGRQAPGHRPQHPHPTAQEGPLASTASEPLLRSQRQLAGTPAVAAAACWHPCGRSGSLLAPLRSQRQLAGTPAVAAAAWWHPCGRSGSLLAPPLALRAFSPGAGRCHGSISLASPRRLSRAGGEKLQGSLSEQVSPPSRPFQREKRGRAGGEKLQGSLSEQVPTGVRGLTGPGPP